MSEKKYHGLPGNNQGLDSHWFERLNEFQKIMTLRQIKFKKDKWPYLDDGEFIKWPNYYYPHILPAGNLEKNFYPGIFSDVQQYLRENDVELHTEALNLLSSQVCCFNFLFPLKKDIDKANSILSAVLPRLKEVLNIKFEYTGPDSTTEWLGESSIGKRGQNRTSIDAAVWWVDKKEYKKLTLIEWKFTEKAFGTCGGYASKGNNNRQRCRTVRIQAINPEADCYIASGKDDRTSRHYWEHLSEAGISLDRFGIRPGCPFIGPLYQLMRQYLLAAYCRAKITDIQAVDIVIISFKENQSLKRTPRHLNHLGGNVIKAWNNLLTTAPPLRHVYIEDIMKNAVEDDWKEYLRLRYGI